MFEHSFTEYLKTFRKPWFDRRVIKQVIRGVKELHAMGFVHHSLSYDHIVFDAHPLITKIIDFKSVRPVESKDEIEFEG